MPEIFTRNITEKKNAHLFSLFAYKDMYMMFYIRVNKDKFFNLRPVLAQIASLSITTPSRAIIGQNLAFGFVLQNNKLVNLPVALPVMKSDNSYPDAIITYTQLDSDDSKETLIPLNITSSDRVSKYMLNNDKYWKNLEQITFPFIPYISNCRNYGEFIFLNDVIENQNLCKIYAPNATIPVDQFGFLQAPTSDECEDVEFTCIMDDAFYTSQQYPKLYEQSILAELFYITSEPIDFQASLIENGVIFDSLSLIPVIGMNTVPSTQLPKEIVLEIMYYQVNKYQKRIIKSEMRFGQLIEKSNLLTNSSFTYKFHLKFTSMNHAELAISFAFGIPVYIILSFIIGMFSIIMIFFYYCFFRTANMQIFSQFITILLIFIFFIILLSLCRREVTFQKSIFLNRRGLRRACKDLKEFLQLYKPISQGIFLGFIPNFIILFFISFFMIGGFWSNPFFNCTDLSTEKICETSIFESFGSNQVSQTKRRGRLGLTLIVIGFYAIVRISSVYIPSNTKDKIRESVKSYTNSQSSNKNQNKFFQAIVKLEDRDDFLTTESYDGNIWNDKVWLRGLFIHMTMFIMTIYIIVITLSFSAYYGANIWFFTFILKICQIFIEESLKVYIENELLLTTLSCVISMSNSVSGLGATDFFDYLFNTFINLGISTFEKTNQVIVVDIVADKINEILSYLSNWIQKQFHLSKIEFKVFHIDQNENEEEEDQEDMNQDKKNKNGDIVDDDNKDEDNSQATGQKELGNSSIFLTDNCQESMLSIDFQGNIHSFFKLLIQEKIIKQDDESRNQDLDEKKQQLKYQNSLKLFDDFKGLNRSETVKVRQTKIFQKLNSDEDDFEKDSLELAFEELINQKYTRNPITLAARQKTIGNSTDEEDLSMKYSLRLKMFGDFCNNTFNLIATPCQVVCLWIFFDANQMFVKWGINKKGIVYYYLFNVLNIPFTMVVDILFLKTVEQFHDINVREYFAFIYEKFKLRYLTWKADEEEQDEIYPYLEQDLKSIHTWYFSPQFFFCLSIFVAGCIGIIEGVLTIIVNQYNFFSDSSSFFYICLFWLPICFAFDFICVRFFCERIWGVKQNEEFNVKDHPKESDVQSPISLNEQQKSNKITTLKSPLAFSKFKTPKLGVEEQGLNNIFSNENLILRNEQQFLDENNNQIYSMNWLQTSRLGNSLFQDLARNQTTLLKSKFRTKDSHKEEKPLVLQNTISPDFYQQLKQVLFDESFIEEMSSLKESLENNRYLRLFFEDQVEQLYDYDISVHQFILSFQEKSDEQTDKIYQLFLHNFKRFKIQQDAFDQYQKLKKFDFKKAIQQKEKKSKYQDIQQHFAEVEYKDQKFLKKFLELNKAWLRKNMKLFFDDLMYGEKRQELKILRELILQSFSSIYGDVKIEGTNQEIQVKNVFKKTQPLKQEVQQYQDTSFHYILKSWLRRCRILKLAEQLIGGYFLKVEARSCFYCKSNWGLTIQTANKNIEDLFQEFYKRECKRKLLENSRIVASPYVYQIPKYPPSVISNTGLFYQDDQGDNFSSPPRSFREDFDMENENILYSQDENEDNDQAKKRLEEERKMLNNPDQFKQRFIDRWQEYFTSHAQNIAVCLQCNDQAQDQFVKKLTEKRQKKEREYQLIRETIQMLNSQKSSYLIHQPTLQDIEDIDSQKKDPSLPNYLLTPYGFKKGGENIIVSANQIIEEDYNEDQSYLEDKLSKFDDSFHFNHAHEDHMIIKKKQKSSQSNSHLTNHNKRGEAIEKRERHTLNVIDDDHLGLKRRKSSQLNQSQRSIKSEKRTHPYNTEQDEGIEANQDDIKIINDQIQEENRSFKVVSARKNSVAYFEDFNDKDQVDNERKGVNDNSSDQSSEEEDQQNNQQEGQYEDSESSEESDYQYQQRNQGFPNFNRQMQIVRDELINQNKKENLQFKRQSNILQNYHFEEPYKIQSEPSDRDIKGVYNTYTLNEEDEIDEENRISSQYGQGSQRSRQISKYSKNLTEENDFSNQKSQTQKPFLQNI